MNIAIVGATGLVGSTFIKILQEENLKADNYYLFASKKSQGKIIKIFDKRYKVEALTEENLKGKKIDVAFFSAGSEVSKRFVPLFTKIGTIVIDNSSCFRMKKNVPLVVPEVNEAAISGHNGIIANPNCATIQAAVILGPLHRQYGLKRVVISTYQAVSGVGACGIEELKNPKKYSNSQVFAARIFSNTIPLIGSLTGNGYSEEENKIINETRKILDIPNLAITATCARVPVMNCHSESISIELNKNFKLSNIEKIVKNACNISVNGDIMFSCPTTVDADGKNQVFVGRLRRDYSVKNGINLWCVADNLRRGAAFNAAQIFKALIKLYNLH